MESTQNVGCGGCGGLMVVADESTHPCGVCVQHGHCADCGVRSWRLLDEWLVPLPDRRGSWTISAGVDVHTVRREVTVTDRPMRPRNRPAQRADRTRP